MRRGLGTAFDVVFGVLLLRARVLGAYAVRDTLMRVLICADARVSLALSITLLLRLKYDIV